MEFCETCGRNFFNLAFYNVAVVFSIVQFILFLRFASNIERRAMKNFRVPGGVKLFLLRCDLKCDPNLVIDKNTFQKVIDT